MKVEKRTMNWLPPVCKLAATAGATSTGAGSAMRMSGDAKSWMRATVSSRPWVWGRFAPWPSRSVVTTDASCGRHRRRFPRSTPAMEDRRCGLAFSCRARVTPCDGTPILCNGWHRRCRYCLPCAGRLCWPTSDAVRHLRRKGTGAAVARTALYWRNGRSCPSKDASASCWPNGAANPQHPRRRSTGVCHAWRLTVSRS